MTSTLWTDATGAVTVTHDQDNRFYELREHGQSAGLLVYERKGDRYDLTHTSVQDGFRGRGLGTALIREALTDLRERGATVVNRCPVIDRFLDKQPQFQDVLTTGPHTPEPH